MNPPSEMSATQRALAIPELVQRIIGFLQFHESFSGSERDLADNHDGVLDNAAPPDSYFSLPYILVSKLWYAEAMPYLWRAIDRGWMYPHQGLQDILSRIDPERRQFHANLITAVTMNAIIDKEIDQANQTLSSLSFPRLKQLTIWAGSGFSSNIPKLGPNEVTRLLIKPRYDVHPFSYWVADKDWKKMFDSAAVRFLPASADSLKQALRDGMVNANLWQVAFPKLRNVRIIDQACMKRQTLEEFKGKMDLDVFDHDCVEIAE